MIIFDAGKKMCPIQVSKLLSYGFYD